MVKLSCFYPIRCSGDAPAIRVMSLDAKQVGRCDGSTELDLLPTPPGMGAWPGPTWCQGSAGQPCGGPRRSIPATEVSDQRSHEWQSRSWTRRRALEAACVLTHPSRIEKAEASRRAGLSVE